MEKGKQTIEFILMGQAVPEERKDRRRISQCTAGFSPTLDSLIRIYPIPADYKLKRWTLYEIDVERNPQDKRIESWKLQGSRRMWETAKERIRIIGKLKRDEWISLILQLANGQCTVDLNKEKLSLAVVKPDIMRAYISDQEITEESVQLRLNGKRPPPTGKSSPHILRIEYRCSDCKQKTPHDHHLLEYGVYNWIFKNKGNRAEIEKVIDNLRLFDDDYEKYFLIGNLNKYKSSWMVISVLRFKK